MIRPDNRPSETVWKYFELAFTKTDFPSLSWAIGSDWGMGSAYGITPAEYRKKAETRMIAIYGPKPQD